MSVQQNKFLTFTIENEAYGIGILKIKEIIGMMAITHVPKMPEFVKGVVNLRGKIIPVMDLRLKLGMEGREYNDRTCIIVVEIDTTNGTNLTGLVVDTVSEVLDIKEENIEAAPAYFEGEEQEFIIGIGKVKDKVIMLLDAEKMLSSKDKELIQKI